MVNIIVSSLYPILLVILMQNYFARLNYNKLLLSIQNVFTLNSKFYYFYASKNFKYKLKYYSSLFQSTKLNKARLSSSIKYYSTRSDKKFLSNLELITNAKMIQVLNVAEKNDAAKNLAEILSRGGFTRKEGFSKFNKIYEFPMVLQGQRCQMIFTSVSGHLLTHSFFGNHKKWYGCSPVELFDAPIIKICIENMEPIQKTLQGQARKAQKLIIWTDCDREGENIGFEVIKVCTEINPNLIVQRAKFSEITFASVNRAMNNLVDPDHRQNNAVEVRSELDLRIGAAFTRFQTLRLKKVFPQALADVLISYGSCQFPTLGFVVERYKAIEEFVPEQFWKIEATHEHANCVVKFIWKRVRLFDELVCQVLHERCLENSCAKVEHVTSKPKSKWRPLPLDTVELEKLSSRKLKLTAKETMKIAEKLYTSGLISYPRTETNIFPKELNLVPLVQMQSESPQWGEFASQLLQQNVNPRQGKKSDQAHPPIHPTKYASNLNGNEKRVYEFIVRHFLACCSKDAKGTETIVQISIHEEQFSASGLIILERNYLEVYPYDRWSEKEMPEYRVGQTFEPSSIEMIGGETTPPPLLTEADLIALMEKHGIGTDATHADHIEKIKSRSYVYLHESKFLPGQLGMGLVQGYDAMGFRMSKPDLRASFEADLKSICEGTKNPQDVLRNQVNSYKGVFQEAMIQASKIDEALAQYLDEAPQIPNDNDLFSTTQDNDVVRKCPVCNSSIVLKKKKDGIGFYLGCLGFPDCKIAIWFPEFSIKNITVTDEICSECEGSPKKLKFEFNGQYYFPRLPHIYTACIGGCDSSFLETLNMQTWTNRQGNQGLTNNTPSSSDSGYSSSFRTASHQTPSSSTSSVNFRPPPSTNGTIQANRNNNIQQRPSFTRSDNFQRPNNIPRNSFQSSQNSASSTNSAVGSDSESIKCHCNQEALMLTVRKEGPNTGRQFYKCSKPQNMGCNFFEWADNAQNGSTTPRTTGRDSHNNNNTGTQWRSESNFGSDSSSFSRGSFPGSSNGSPADVEDIPTCNCGTPSRTCITQKEGPNKNRSFFTCAKPRDQQCGFFQWVDQMNSQPSTSATWRPRGGGTAGVGRGRGGGVKRKAPDEGATRRRKCGICGIEGHNRKSCPTNDS